MALIISTDETRILRYVPNRYTHESSRPPIDLSYTTGLTRRLHPQKTFAQGELTDVIYWDGDGEGMGDPIIHERHVYTRDAMGFAISRNITISWFREDGTEHPYVKVLHKVYTGFDKLREGQRRRQNVVDDLEYTVAGYLIATNPTDPEAALNIARDFMDDYDKQINAFMTNSSRKIYNSILNDNSYSFLDDVIAAPDYTVRDLMLDKVNIWGL